MASFRNGAQPLWPADRWRFSSSAERSLRDLSHLSLLVFVAAAVAMGILAGVSLSSRFGLGLASSFIVVAILFPLLCGLLVKEVWHAKRLESQIKGQETGPGFMGNAVMCDDNTPAGLLIVSHDLRVQFANQKYLESTLQQAEEALGRRVCDVLPAEALDDHAGTLLARSEPSASCCFNTSMRAGLGREWPVHITMTRIAPWQGQARILVIVEDLLPSPSARAGVTVEGYVC